MVRNVCQIVENYGHGVPNSLGRTIGGVIGGSMGGCADRFVEIGTFWVPIFEIFARSPTVIARSHDRGSIGGSMEGCADHFVEIDAFWVPFLVSGGAGRGRHGRSQLVGFVDNLGP